MMQRTAVLKARQEPVEPALSGANSGVKNASTLQTTAGRSSHSKFAEKRSQIDEPRASA